MEFMDKEYHTYSVLEVQHDANRSSLLAASSNQAVSHAAKDPSNALNKTTKPRTTKVVPAFLACVFK